MAVKNLVLAVTLVLGPTSLALAQADTRIGPAGVHRTAQVGLQERPLAGAAIARRPYAAARMYRRAYGPLVSAPVGLYGGYGAYQGYQSYPGVSYQDNPFEEPETPGSSGY